MDYTASSRQEAQRKRDRENGIGYLQVRISNETKEILRRRSAKKQQTLAEYVRLHLDSIAKKIVRIEQEKITAAETQTEAKKTESEIINATQNPKSQTQVQQKISLKQQKILAIMKAFNISKTWNVSA